MSDLVVGRVEFCPKVCCSGEVDMDTIAKGIAEKLEQEMASFKGFCEEDEKQVEKQPIYVLTYEREEQIKQEKIVAESIEEAMEIIIRSPFVGFDTVDGKAIYIRSSDIIEIREHDEKQDEHKLGKEDVMLEKIKIGWKEYTIQNVNPSQMLMDGGEECYGQIMYDECAIYLNDNNSKEQDEVTLIHEVIHGIEDMYGLELGEENVMNLANALYTLIKDNRKLLRRLV